MAHLMACIFYAISYLPGSVDSSHNWRCVELEVCSDEGDERDLFEHYIVSLFWSFTTITTVGYGDIVPVNKYERLISILCMVAGVGLFGYLMGTLSSMVQKMNMDELLELERQDALQAFLAYRALPQHLSDRITEYYKFVWERELRLQERDWLHGLSSSLRTEAVLYMYQDAVEHIPFLHDKNIHFIADMMLQLRRRDQLRGRATQLHVFCVTGSRRRLPSPLGREGAGHPHGADEARGTRLSVFS
uniref:Cyclic nucleotide-binding protein n=1 Tax=Tetraselmis sp. GSL018 TaxID=582737 RepID=A0A061R5N6_9CHLO